MVYRFRRMSNDNTNDSSIIERARDLVSQHMPNRNDASASVFFGPPAFGAGVAVAAYNGFNLEPTFSLVFGSMGMVVAARCICSTENGEHALLRSFVAGFVSAGVFRYFFF